MIFVSDHAFISKWWWIGAIRKTRRPRYLKVKTWSITESASITKMPPISSSSNSVFVITANAAERAAERHRARVAHEHLGREGVVPEEADRAADQRRAEDRQVEPSRRSRAALAGAERMNVSTFIAVNVKSAMIAGAGGEAVDAVGQVRRRSPRRR